LPALRFGQRHAHGGKTQAGYCSAATAATSSRPHGTVMERSHIPVHKGCWRSSAQFLKKGMSAHQLHRSLGVTTRAVFLAHRIREP